MALRDQPYLPLFVDDFMSDEKLNLCSAEATGVYIRLMCLMHKMEEYGVVALSKLDKVSDDQIRNFALLLSKQMPYEAHVIYRSIYELSERKVIQIKGDKLYQKRMVRDAGLSKKRAIAGAKGGKQKAIKIPGKTESKDEANSVNEIVIVNENIDIDQSLGNEESTDARAREEISRVTAFYEQQIGALPSPSAIEMLLAYTEDMGAEVVCKAVEIAVDAGAKNWRYIESVLQNWTKQKVKSLADVQRIEAQRQKMKEAGNGRNTGSAPTPDKPKRSLGGVIEL